jgi:hypothetical protein
MPSLDDELRSIARGDAAKEQLLRDSLRRLAEGAAGPELREMAHEVMAGRVTLRQAMLSRVYSEALWPYAERLLRWREDLRAEEDQRGAGDPARLTRPGE